MKNKTQHATFAAGCFWGVEELFRTTLGVQSTSVGYTGGHTKNPIYQDVCSDTTGHAEAVHIEFDPDEISYEKLVRIFFENHNPTTRNRQGPDVGSQYRSVIFYHTKQQEEIAKKVKAELEKSKKFNRPIVTEIVAAQTFYPAEEYHQKYIMKGGEAACHI